VPVAHAELFTVGCDRALVTFTSDAGEAAVTHCGDAAIESTGPRHVVRLTGLEPDTDYELAVDGVEPDAALPARFRTLARPSGRLLATIATANDVHFGETECGHLGPPHEDIGPIFRSAPGDPPYPEVMNGAVIEAMQALDPDVVVVKGDLTDRGTEEQFAAFLAAYGVFGDRLAFVRGNHDAMQDPTMAIEDAPFSVDVGGVTVAVLDTTVPGRTGGHLTTDQLQWLDDLGAETAGPVLVFAHHDLWPIDAPARPHEYLGLTPDSSEALAGVVARRESIAGYFAGHTHASRAYRFASARNVPFVEVACAKDYPGAWAEYRVFEGGYTQVMRRISNPDALAWSERCRHMIQGIYRDLVLGTIDDRCFTQLF
jgi:predicted phosphodiesterase